MTNFCILLVLESLEEAKMSPKDYRKLIYDFLENKISVDAFEAQYLANFKAEPVGMDSFLFEVLETLFEAVDSYWHECLPENETVFMISEKSLRQEATTALRVIDRYLLAQSPITQ
jgi:hypothetical protein